LTVTFVIEPDMPETTILVGYSEAGAGVDVLSLIVINVGFVKIIPSHGVGVGVGVKVAVTVGVGV